MKRPRVAVGDVFTTPIDGRRAAVGQVVGKYLKDAYYIVVYDFLVSPEEDATKIEAMVKESKALLLALTFDAKFRLGHWHVFTNVEVPPGSPLPAYREMVSPSGRVDVVDYSGTRRRPATKEEASSLPNREVVAPVRVEKAAQAFHGAGPWEAAYDHLRDAASSPGWQAYFRDEPTSPRA